MKLTADNSIRIRFERLAWRPSPGTTARAAAAGVASFLLFGPYLANLSRDYTRFCYFWRVGDTASVIAVVLAVGLVFFLVAEAIRRTRRPILIRLCHHVFLAVLGAGLLANMLFAAAKLPSQPFTPSREQISLAWVVLFAILGYSFGSAQARLVLRGRQFCQIIAPVVPLTFLGLALSSYYPEEIEPLNTPPQPCAAALIGGSPRPGGVYVFVFDEWSYERTFASGEVDDRYPNLAEFSKNATVYTDAHSPAGNTEQSLPSILFQTADPVVVDHRRFGFEGNGEYVPATEHESLFDRLDKLNRPGVMLGFALPYRLWLGNGPQACRSYCYYSRATSPGAQAALHLLNALRYSPEPLSRRWYKQTESRWVHSVICGILGHLRQDVHAVIREWPPAIFMFAHLHLPHMPAVAKPDLTFRTAAETAWRDDDLAGYESNLAALDSMVGEFIGALREAGKYDDAVVILTSDHSWRNDPDRLTGRSSVPITHVPLLVKGPRQTAGTRLETRFELTKLGELMESLAGAPAPSNTLVMEDRNR